MKPFALTMHERLDIGIPHPATLIPLLETIRGYLDEDCPDIDVRLRVHHGQWQILSGPSDYDQDHRGYWGASSIDRDTLLEFVAISLVEQVQEAVAENEMEQERNERERLTDGGIDAAEQ